MRRHLGIERWLVYGVSWGSTLGLTYAERHPDRVSEARPRPCDDDAPVGVAWLTRGAGRFLPAEWDRFRRRCAPEDRDGDLAAAYSRLLEHSDPVVHERAARAWCDWEEALVALETGGSPIRDTRIRASASVSRAP